MNRSHVRRSRRGLAMILALTMLGIVSITIGVIVVVVVQQARRTANLEAEAQAQQMILAGLLLAPTKLDAPPADAIDLPLPPALAERGGRLTLHITPASTGRHVEITARVGRMSRQQDADFSNASGRWIIAVTDHAQTQPAPIGSGF